jgi:CheY-like chemotaxis protein
MVCAILPSFSPLKAQLADASLPFHSCPSQPKLDGYGLLAALRNTTDEDQVYIPVILVTARAGEEERVNGLLAGAEDYLSKASSAFLPSLHSRNISSSFLLCDFSLSADES